MRNAPWPRRGRINVGSPPGQQIPMSLVRWSHLGPYPRASPETGLSTGPRPRLIHQGACKRMTTHPVGLVGRVGLERHGLTRPHVVCRNPSVLGQEKRLGENTTIDPEIGAIVSRSLRVSRNSCAHFPVTSRRCSPPRTPPTRQSMARLSSPQTSLRPR